jgi:hypothetical protein
MEILFIEGTKSSPKVRFDPATGVLEISGKSYPENAPKFYGPIFEWLHEYLDTGRTQSTQVILEIVYFNSSSSKALLNILDLLDQAARNGKKIVIDWRYHPENETALECGEEFAEEVHAASFNLVESSTD